MVNGKVIGKKDLMKIHPEILDANIKKIIIEFFLKNVIIIKF